MSAEFEIDPPDATIERFVQTSVAVAFDGSAFVVAWTDDRTGLPNIYTTRVDLQGACLDIGGVPLAPPGRPRRLEFDGQACLDGGTCLTAWEEVLGATVAQHFAALVETAPGPAVSATLTLAVTSGPSPYSALLSDGSQFLYAYFAGTLEAVRYAADGTLLDLSPRPGPSGNVYTQMAGTWDGTNYVFVWDTPVVGVDNCQIHGAAIDPDGGWITPTAFPASDATTYKEVPVVAGSPALSLAVWTDYGPLGGGSNVQAIASRFQTDGGFLDPMGIGLDPFPTDQYDPAAAFDGTGFWVAWSDRRNATLSGGVQVHGNRLRLDGTSFTDAGYWIGGSDAVSGPFISCGAGICLVVWLERDTPASWHVRGARVDPAGPLDLDGGFAIPPLRAGASREAVPGGACDGEQCLVVWVEAAETGLHVRAARWPLGPAVARLLPTLATQASPSSNVADLQPEVSLGPGSALVAWGENQTPPFVLGTTVSADLIQFDGGAESILPLVSGIPDSGSGTLGGIATAFDGSLFWLLFIAQPGTLSAMRFDPAGRPIDPRPFALCPSCAGALAATDVRMVSGPANSLVAWTSGPGNLDATRISLDGGILDPAGIHLVSDGGAQGTPALAAAPDQYLAVWRDFSDGSAFDMMATRVLLDGGLLDPMGILIARAGGYWDQYAFPDHDVTAAWLDGGYVIAWCDHPTDGGATLFAAQLGESGPPSAPWVLSGLDLNDRHPSLVPVDDNTLLALYQRYDATPDYRAVRGRARWIGAPRQVTWPLLDSGVGDGGASDGGASDGGNAPGGPAHDRVGCGCEAAPPAFWGLAMLLAAAREREGRRRRPTTGRRRS